MLTEPLTLLSKPTQARFVSDCKDTIINRLDNGYNKKYFFSSEMFGSLRNCRTFAIANKAET